LRCASASYNFDLSNVQYRGGEISDWSEASRNAGTISARRRRRIEAAASGSFRRSVADHTRKQADGVIVAGTNITAVSWQNGTGASEIAPISVRIAAPASCGWGYGVARGNPY
jgi:hypothetical protein